MTCPVRQPSTNVSASPGSNWEPAQRFELGQGLLDQERRPVGPVGRHRIERVCDSEQAGLDRDLLAAEAMWIASAVPTLVVVEHVRQSRAEVVDGFDQTGARDRMRPDLGQLLFRQRTGLAEHARVDGDLADVVERTAEPERVEPLTPPAEPSRETLCDQGDASGVAAKIWVPGLERGREGSEQ